MGRQWAKEIKNVYIMRLLLPPWRDRNDVIERSHADRLCHNSQNRLFCHSERSEESDLPMSYAIEILRLTPQNDIVTQSESGTTTQSH